MGSEVFASAELQFIDITTDEAMVQTGERIQMEEWSILGGFKRECVLLLSKIYLCFTI